MNARRARFAHLKNARIYISSAVAKRGVRIIATSALLNNNQELKLLSRRKIMKQYLLLTSALAVFVPHWAIPPRPPARAD